MGDLVTVIIGIVLILAIFGYIVDALEKNKSKKNRLYNVDYKKNDDNLNSEPYNIYKEKGYKQSDSSYHPVGSPKQNAKQQYKENKKSGIVSCPKCGSESITTTNKKISVGKGVAGAAVGSIINPVGTVVGAAVGATHSKKIYNVCMNCGHKWKP